MTVARCMRCAGRLGDVETAAGLNLDAGHSVPGAQLGERDAEVIGNGDQRIASARDVKHHVRGGDGDRSEGNGERFDALEAVCRAELIGFSKLGLRDAELVGDRGEGVALSDRVIAPRSALGLRNGGDALLIERG